MQARTPTHIYEVRMHMSGEKKNPKQQQQQKDPTKTLTRPNTPASFLHLELRRWLNRVTVRVRFPCTSAFRSWGGSVSAVRPPHNAPSCTLLLYTVCTFTQLCHAPVAVWGGPVGVGGR